MGQLQRRNAELVDLLSADFINCWIPIEQVVSAEAYSFVTFRDIPQNFRALVLAGQIRTDRIAEQDVLRVRLNDDSGNDYNYIQADLYCTDTISTDCDRGASSFQAGLCEAVNSRTDTYAPFLLRFPGYARLDRTKWMVLLQGGRIGIPVADDDLRISFNRGLWEILEPITSVTLFPGVGPNFVPNCIFELFGIL